MFWISLVLLYANATWTETCEEKLENRFKQDLIPRIKTYLENGIGLDFVEKYSECSSEKGIYAYIFWMKTLSNRGTYGFCLPRECNMEEGQKILEGLSLKYRLPEKIISTKVLIKCLDFSKTEPKSEASNIFILCFLILIFLEVTCTFHSLIIKENHFLNNFSILKNFENLLNYSKSSDNLGVLNGIRSIASLTIIFYHSFVFSYCFATSNRIELINILSSFPVCLITAFSYSVDIFFILSGFLMSFLTIQELKVKGKNFSWMKYFSRRLMRILPILYFLVGIDRALYGTTPESVHLIISLACFSDIRIPWWSALILIQNLFPNDEGFYLGWIWTTSADFQFYLASSLILIAYFKNKSWGYALSLFYFLCSMGCIIYFGIVHKYTVSAKQILENMEFFGIIYMKPYTRISTFIIGMVLGLVYLKATQNKTKVSLAYSEKDSWGNNFEIFLIKIVNQERYRVLFYFIGLIFVAFSMVGPHYYNIYGEDSLGIIINSLWLALQRPIFGLGFSFLVFPILIGHLKTFRIFLEMRIFKFLADISYTMYTIHPMVFFFLFMNGNEMVYFQWKNVFWMFLVLYGTSVFISIILKVLIETPFLNLSRNYLSR